MHRTITKLVGLIFLGGIVPAGASEPVPQAYVNQLDAAGFEAQPQLGTDGAAYVNQVPADARPSPPRKKARPLRKDALPTAKKPAMPDVGAGVSLALAPAKQDAELPNVGRGVVR